MFDCLVEVVTRWLLSWYGRECEVSSLSIILFDTMIAPSLVICSPCHKIIIDSGSVSFVELIQLILLQI